jgi:hypothetical protein
MMRILENIRVSGFQRMMRYMGIFIFVLCLLSAHTLFAEDRTLGLEDIGKQYESLRQMSLDPEGMVEVDRFSLKKDVAEFEFSAGYIYFFQSVSDRIVAAYFEGEGVFRLATDNLTEKAQLVRFSGQEEISLDFDRAIFFFTDSTHEYIIAACSSSAISIPDSACMISESLRKTIRDRFEWNIDARILCDLVSTRYGEFFGAWVDCSDGKDIMFIVDPYDAEAVSLLRYEKIEFSKRACWETWYSSRTLLPFSHEEPDFNIEKTDLNIVIDKRNDMSVRADMDFVCGVEDVRITALDLVPVLRVESAILDDTDTCLVIQEDANADGQLWLVFPETLEKNKRYRLRIAYSGRGIIEDLGGDNFAIMARSSWFPSFYTNQIDPRRFLMKFAVPSKMTLLATGKLIDSRQEADTSYTKWDSGKEHDFAGFNYGKFSSVTEKSSKCVIECYTNMKLTDELLSIRQLLEEHKELQASLMMLPHELTTDRVGKNAAIESRNAYEIYNHFFGEIPFREIKISQQPDISFAQSWPTLIYLPFTAFWEESLKERLGLLRGEAAVMGYETIASHELAHQWWGNAVMRDSYHDEWLVEGFATYSSALYLQATSGTDRFKDYMNMQRRLILSRAEQRRNYNELGPVWLGERLSSLDFPGGSRLMYAKGAYVLHMLRMMLFDYGKKSDECFIKMMKDYVRTYAGKIATTEDFKKIVQKHFDREMDWFFDQWVYGTDIPVYKFEYEIEKGDEGYFLTVYAQQSGVPPSFEMPVPFVVNFENGHAVVHLTVKGNDPIGKKFHLPDEPKSIEPNPWNAVLCTVVK